jgi:hypothetical protein
MKTPKLNWLFAFVACIGALFISGFAHAQEITAAPEMPITLTPEAQNFVLDLFTGLIAKYPVLATLVAILGSMRVWAKPFFSAVHALVQLTPSKTDDGWWASAYDFFTLTPTGKTLAWLLDYVASIKLVPPAKTAPAPEPAAPVA